MRSLRLLVFLCFTAGVLAAAAQAPQGPHWARVGGQALHLGLAGPVGGPVLQAVFSQDGRQLYTRTSSGRTWVSEDLGETWEIFTLAAADVPPFDLVPAPAVGVPPPSGAPEALVMAHPYVRGRAYALGRHLYRSPDDGDTWINLTAEGPASVIGFWQTSIAFHPMEADLVVVSNALGLWKSADGGLSWSSLNDRLPNFPAAQFVSGGRPQDGLIIRAERLGLFELTGGAVDFWRRGAVEDQSPAWIETLPEADRLRMSPIPTVMPAGVVASFRVWNEGAAVSPDLTLCGRTDCSDPAAHSISAIATIGGDLAPRQYYVGTSDGLLWASDDGGRSWRESGLEIEGSAVSSIYTDASNPLIAVAVFQGSAEGRVFRTTNGGRLWQDLTADLPQGQAFAAVASAEGGAVYIAGEFGVFYNNDGLEGPVREGFWRSAGGDIPRGSVRDLLLDDVSGFLYASVEGFGVFRARAPAVLDALRVLNAADLSRRPAAPGSLLTILGAQISGVSVGGVTAPVLSAGDRESQIQVPFEASGEQLELSLETTRGLSKIGYPLSAVSPAIFVDRGGPLVLDAGTGRVLGPTFPARAGSQILILATGLGRVRPEWPTGLPAPLENPPATVRPVNAYLNGIPLKVISSGLAGGYIGTYLVQAEIPPSLNFGIGELSLEVGGLRSNAVRIYTRP